jgi:hypothetical protein
MEKHMRFPGVRRSVSKRTEDSTASAEDGRIEPNGSIPHQEPDMNAYESEALAHVTIEHRISEAKHRRQARESRRRERPAARTTVQEPRRHSHLWSVLHPSRLQLRHL